MINALRKKVRETEKSGRKGKWETIQIFTITINNKKAKKEKKTWEQWRKRRKERTETKEKMKCV